MKFIDLFAGAGGFGLGFQLAGWDPLLSLEIDRSACKTLSYNNPHTIINSDIRKLNTKSKINKYLVQKPDVIIGGPPCQGFSVAASNRVKNTDQRNYLFEDYLNWVKVLQPKAFVIENVKGILTKKQPNGKTILEELELKAKKLDYHISTWVLNASEYGVPQNRIRAFIIGTKDRFNLKQPIISHSNDLSLNKKKKVVVGDAILDLPKIKAREGKEEMEYGNVNTLTEYQKWARRRSKKVFNHVAMKHTNRIVERYKLIMSGETELPDELKVRKRNGNGELSSTHFNLNYRHLSPENISYTIPASFYSSFIHPTHPRNITAREAARLQSFPDYYKFVGSRTLISNKLLQSQGKEDQINLSQYNQVGNAVPPLLARAVGKRLKQYLSK